MSSPRNMLTTAPKFMAQVKAKFVAPGDNRSHAAANKHSGGPSHQLGGSRRSTESAALSQR